MNNGGNWKHLRGGRAAARRWAGGDSAGEPSRGGREGRPGVDSRGGRTKGQRLNCQQAPCGQGLQPHSLQSAEDTVTVRKEHPQERMSGPTAGFLPTGAQPGPRRVPRREENPVEDSDQDEGCGCGAFLSVWTWEADPPQGRGTTPTSGDSAHQDGAGGPGSSRGSLWLEARTWHLGRGADTCSVGQASRPPAVPAPWP